MSDSNSEQAAKDHTLKIGITGSYIGGRIQPSVNSWTSKLPSASNQPGTRLMTIGTYRGNNYTYSFTVPASAFNKNTRDWNQLKLNVISGRIGQIILVRLYQSTVSNLNSTKKTPFSIC
ncbi:MAG: polysaccharide lyase family protein [Eubacteriales bacterium]